MDHTTHEPDIDRLTAQRDKLKLRHATAITKLLEDREDLRGMHAFADVVEESVRWSA